MCLTMVAGPLLGGVLAAPVHLYLTDSKDALESWKVKSFKQVGDSEVAMTERRLNDDFNGRKNTEG